MQIISRFFKKYADKLIWVSIGIYIAIFSYLCFLKYNSFGYYDWDFASDVITYWNSVHGRFLYYPFLEEIIFGAHLYLIIFLIIPIYVIFQHPFTVLFLQTLALGLAAYPLYLLAKLKLSKFLSLWVSIAYLLYPSVGYINLFETHFESYTIFFLFFALYYFEKVKFNSFLIFVLLAMSCKENISLIIAMFGIYALLRKMPWKWILVPLLVGMAWFVLSVKVVIPYFAKEARFYPGGFMFAILYRHLGANLGQMINTLFLHPIYILNYAFMPGKILYIFKLFMPTAFIGFFSPAALLMTVPIFGQNLLSGMLTQAQIGYQYVAPLIPFIFCSFVFGLKKFLDRNVNMRKEKLLIILSVILVVVSGIQLRAPQFNIIKYIKAYKVDDLAKEKERLVKLIPRQSATIASFQFLPKLASRYELYSMHFVSTGFKMYTNAKYELPKNLEYALIDFNEPLMIGSFFLPASRANIRSFLEGGNWKVVGGVNDTVLFKKNYPNGHGLCELVNDSKVQNIINANSNNQIIFLGYDIPAKDKLADNILPLVYYWKIINKVNDQLISCIQLLDYTGRVAYQGWHVLGYRIYEPSLFGDGQIIKEYYYLLIPSTLKGGIYSMRMALFTDKGNVLPILDKQKTDRFGRLIIGEFKIGDN